MSATRPAATGVRVSGEVRRFWPLLLWTTICFTTGMGATVAYGTGAFMPYLEAEFGWSRSQISLGVTIMSLGMALFSAGAGKLADRYGTHRVALASYIAYGAAVLAMIPALESIWTFWMFHFLISTVGQGTTPVVLVRPIIGTFFSSRGLALGIVAVGSGFAAFWVPAMVVQVSQLAGWRSAYALIGLLALAIAPLAYFGLRPGAPMGTKGDPKSLDPTGISAAAARRSAAFWILMAISFIIGISVPGIVVHMVAFLSDGGVALDRAAMIAGTVGLASIVGRVVMGVMLDHLDTVLASLGTMLCAILGVLVLLVGGPPYAWGAAVLIGFALGAETDMLAFITARLFGAANYGMLFGFVWSAFTVGFGLSPLVVAELHDAMGSYYVAWGFTLFELIVGSLLVLALRPSLNRSPY